MKRRLFFGWLALAVLTCASCGYALAGRGNALPERIRIIGVPQFVNRSTTADIDVKMTEAVRREFQNKGKYQVKPDEGGVDAVLTGVIINVTLQPSAFTAERVPSGYVVVVMASVEFKDLSDPDEPNKVLWANPSFRVTNDYQQEAGATGQLDPAALASSNPQAMERLANAFAKDVVTSIFEAF